MSAASTIDVDLVFLKLFLSAREAGLGRLEAEVLKRVTGRNPFLGADEINQIVTSVGAKENHVGRHAKGNSQAEDLCIEPLGFFKITGKQRNMKKTLIRHGIAPLL